MRLVQSIRDAWVNAITGTGKRSHDKSVDTQFERRAFLDVNTLDSLYTQSGLSARIVDRLPDDATREGFKIEGADESVNWDSIQSKLDDLCVNKHLGDAWRWSRLYGGSLVVPRLIDELDPREPLDLTKIRGIRGFDVVESRFAVPEIHRQSPILTPKHYTIIDQDKVDLYQVHASRVYRFDGVRVPRSVLLDNAGWGPSVLDRVYNQLLRVGDAHSNAGAILHVISQPVLKIAGLKKRLLAGDAEKREIGQLIEEIQEAASVLGWVTLDAEDTFEALERNVEGVVKLIDSFVDDLVHNTGYPREILLGKTEAGLNSGENAGPFRNWYDQVGVEQEKKLSPAINWALSLLFALMQNTEQFEAPGEWTTVFNPLWQMSEKEQAEIEKMRAETDQINFTMGAISNEEVRRARFVERGPIDLSEQAQEDPLDLDLPPQPEEPVLQPEVEEERAVQEEALNGAQIGSLLDIVKATVLGEIPRDAAIGLISVSFPSQAKHAEAILGSAGLEPPPAPAVGPQSQPAVEQPEDEDEPEPSTDAPPDDLVSPREAAQKFGVPTRTVTLAIEREQIQYWEMGRHKRVSLAEVAKFAKSHEAIDDPGGE